MIRRTLTLELVFDPAIETIDEFVAYTDQDVIDMGTVIHAETEGFDEVENSDN